MSRIFKVGFELEGGWKGEPGISPFKDISLIADHSINGQTLKGARALAAPHIGEAVSPPIPFEGEEWKAWLESHWPNADPPDRTNRTCGFHIHTSFQDFLSYSLLSSKSFLLTLRDRMLELGRELDLPSKHVFWERAHGANTFCSLFFDAASQMKVHTKSLSRTRYGWLNFSYGLHQTLEFRALPTFRDSWVGIRFAEAYFQLVDGWLEQQAGKTFCRSITLKG